MLDYQLTGKVALVTGAGGGLGSAVCNVLAASGATVLVADIDAGTAEAVAAGIRSSGGTGEALQVDVTDPAAVDAMVAHCTERLGGPHIAVNNAGIHGDPDNPPIADASLDWWGRVMDLNLNSVFYCLRAEARAMRGAGGGAIVNMASVLGAVGFAGLGAYSTSKHGVVGLTKVAALDHAADGIRVNAVGPAFIDAGLVEKHIPREARAEVAALHPLGRFGTAEEVADLVAFLASDAASFLTGNYYAIEGGYLAR